MLEVNRITKFKVKRTLFSEAHIARVRAAFHHILGLCQTFPFFLPLLAISCFIKTSIRTCETEQNPEKYNLHFY